MIKHIPNALTMMRVLATPFFVFSAINNLPILASAIFILACITDYFDGMLARKYNVITNFGKLMDPLADKFLVLAALVVLCIDPINYIHWSVMVIILFREVAVTVLRHIYHKKNIVIPADKLGKIKTTVQMIGIIFALIFYSVIKYIEQLMTVSEHFSKISIYQENIIYYIQIYFWIVAAITVWSGVNYFYRGASHRDTLRI